jgi:hypothetical protein
MLEYPIILCNEKVKKETGYRLRYKGEEAFEAFLRAAGSYLPPDD